LLGEAGAELVQRMVATGRCHWADPLNAPLSAGEPISAKLLWRFETDGSQKPVIDVPKEMAVIAVAPPWYVDGTTWRCGPIETGLAPRLAAALLAAPKVLPEAAAAVGEALAAVADAGVPAPKVLVQREVKDVEPAPCFTSGDARLTQSSYGAAGLGQRFLDLAQLSFDYEGARVIRQTFHGSQLAQRRRSVAYLSPIARRGQPALRSKRSAWVKFSGADALLGKSYDARLGELWMLSGSDAWLHFMAEVVPKLRAAGWYIETSEDFRYKLVEADEEWQATVEATGNGLGSNLA
jgi:hypothetical protein